MVQELLDAGADVDSRDVALKPPLNWAKDANQEHVVNFFVSRRVRHQINNRIVTPCDSQTPTGVTSSDSALNAEQSATCQRYLWIFPPRVKVKLTSIQTPSVIYFSL